MRSLSFDAVVAEGQQIDDGLALCCFRGDVEAVFSENRKIGMKLWMLALGLLASGASTMETHRATLEQPRSSDGSDTHAYVAHLFRGDVMAEHVEALLLVNGYQVGTDHGLGVLSFRVPRTESDDALRLLARDARIRQYSLGTEPETTCHRIGWRSHSIELPHERAIKRSKMSDLDIRKILKHPDVSNAVTQYPFVAGYYWLEREYLEWGLEDAGRRFVYRARKGYEVDLRLAVSAERAEGVVLGFQVISDGRRIRRAAWRDSYFRWSDGNGDSASN
jgi:hypothetical protein